MKKVWSITVALVATLCIVGSIYAAQAASDIISKSKAKEAALGVTTGNVEEIELENENDRLIYEIELENNKTGKDTEVKVDALTAKVLSVELDDDGKKNVRNNEIAKKQTSQSVNGTEKTVTDQKKSERASSDTADSPISAEQAAKIALQAVGGGTIEEIELDEDDGKLIYEVEIKTSYGEAEVDIDAYSGKVLKIEKDREKNTNGKKTSSFNTENSNKQNSIHTSNSPISSEQAARIALQAVGSGTIEDIELDEDDGKLIYEVEIETTYGEAEVEIDAYSGKVLEVEYDD